MKLFYYFRNPSINMGKWKDFFGALSRNPDSEDEEVAKELNQLILENSESAKRIRWMEDRLSDSKNTNSRTTKTQLGKIVSSKKVEPKVHQASMEEKEGNER